jgi:4-amino-4-deoxy-L-arabinose transferase-like glycosyltransferase
MDMLSGAGGIFFCLICVLLIIHAIRNRSRLHSEIALLLASLNIAILAQWNIAKDFQSVGAGFYAIAVGGFLYWAWFARGRLILDLEPAPVNRNIELVLVIFLLALTIFGRFYLLENIPYGIEGDEAKWTAEAVNLGILGKPDSSGEYHRDALPVSFYIQTPFHRLFGPSQHSARIAVAFLSVVASLIFYWLLRQISSFPIAVLATFLLSVSIFDISASRLANVESFVKIGSVLPLALLAYALKDKRPWQAYAVAGIALAFAALIYDTLWPIGGVCLILMLVEIRSQGISKQDKVKNLTALFAPTALALPMLLPYFYSRISYYEIGEKGWDAEFLSKMWEHFTRVLETWFISLQPDFLYNRPGPLLNSALLPWLAVGTIAALILIRMRVAHWLLIWMAVVIFPVPILTNSPLGRVYYPALPATYGLVALGMFLVWKEVLRIISDDYKTVLNISLLIVMFWIPFGNYYIYFNEVHDPSDRQMRREISEVIAESANPETFILLAVIPGADEPLNNEVQMVDLFLLKGLSPQQAEKAYQYTSLEDVLLSISDKSESWETIVVVLDKTSQTRIDDRAALRSTLQNCYPRGKLVEGVFFERYILDKSAREGSNCKPAYLTLSMPQPPDLSWELSNGQASSLILECEQSINNVQQIEAETIPIAPAWQTEINFAPNWTGTGFLLDLYGSGPISYAIETTFENQETYVWVRTFKRVVDNSPATLTIDNVTLSFADTRGAELNKWIWERIGPFPNNDTILSITMERPYNGDPAAFISLFIDSFIITDDPNLTPDSKLAVSYPPQKYTIHSGDTSGTITTDLPSGQYICRLELESKENLVDEFGKSPVFSNDVNITIP